MPRWSAFDRALARLRQGRPGATDQWAFNRLQAALLMEVYGENEGIPIDKFRYPWASRMIDLVVLVRGNYLTFADIRWQNVECNLDWLERDWPLALEAEATPSNDPAVGIQASAQETPVRQELVSEWPSAEQLGIVKAPTQKAILRKWPELCRRYPNTYNVDKVRAGEVSGGQLAGHVGDVDPKSARAFLRALCAWLEQHS